MGQEGNNFVGVKLGHHTHSDNTRFEFGSGYLYDKHYVCYNVTLERPERGTKRVRIFCPVCEQDLKIKIRSIHTSKTWNAYLRGIGVFFVFLTILTISLSSTIWFSKLIIGGIVSLLFLFYDASDPVIMKDSYFNFWRHKILDVDRSSITLENDDDSSFNIYYAILAAAIPIIIFIAIYFYSNYIDSDNPKSKNPVMNTSTPNNMSSKIQPYSNYQKSNISRMRALYPCKYKIGKLDERFDINKNRLIKIINQASKLWEEVVGLRLFVYDSSAIFKINLIFDERQERLLNEKRIRSKIIKNGKSFDELRTIYDLAIASKEQLDMDYESKQFVLNKKLSGHNAKVKYWNNQGGAPKTEYDFLQKDLADIDKTSKELNDIKEEINLKIEIINNVANNLNELSNQYNLDVKNYNGQFITVREFEKGIYDGHNINIYEFENEKDLLITLVHELGHALGLNHVMNPNAIMYSKLEKQNIRNIQLTADDSIMVCSKLGNAESF
ncbi:MAG: hypothetical protein C0417_07290 [Chlorobiaceae bacterium]|nr:hypothetical protein [Chlorobiaceae bacterium]